jgi:hypothetical protein
VTACHAVLYKRDTRAAIAWVGFIWFVPIFGSLLYLWLGINRVHRRARSLRDVRHLLPVHTVDYRVAPDAEAHEHARSAPDRTWPGWSAR